MKRSLDDLRVLDAGLAMLERGLDMTRRLLGDDYGMLARTLESLDRPEEAMAELGRAVALFESSFGAEHPQTRGARERLMALSH